MQDHFDRFSPARRGTTANSPLILFVLLLFLAACARPPEDVASAGVQADAALSARMDAAARRALTQLPVAGLSIAVMRNDRVVLAKGYGYADLAKRIPASADTIYRLGSIGKEFTAAAVLDLAEQRRLSLSDSITRYLPSAPSTWQRITIRDLLAHTSGLPEGAIAPLVVKTGGVGLTRQDLVERLAAQPLMFEPGTRWSYSNAGYLLAGLVIERVTRTPPLEYLTRELLQRLGLRTTTPCPDEQPEHRLWAHGYEVQEGGWVRTLRLGRPPAFIAPRPINMEIVSSAGGLCSSATDLVRWPLALRSLLKPATLREMSEPTVLKDGTSVAYGLGVQNREFGAHRAVAHGGIINGFVTLLATFPDDNVTVTILVNTLLPSEDQARLLAGEVFSAVFAERGTWHASLDEVSAR